MKLNSYKIEKGKHRSGYYFYPYFFKNKMIGVSYFDDSCLYHIEGNDKKDINKLVGFSVGYHRNNSCRIGWRCMDNKVIELFIYVYNNGKRIYPSKYIGNIKPFEKIYFSIENVENYWVVNAKLGNEQTKEYHIEKNINNFNIGYKLYPYFGGNKKAPHTMNIFMINKTK